MQGNLFTSWKTEIYCGLQKYLPKAVLPCRVLEAGSELFDWDGNLIWEYNYSTPTKTQHHDVCPMPNGNILMLAITVINETEAVQMGRKLLTPPFKQLYNEQILELKPKNSNDADIVWEWNLKDHLIQDHDPLKDNYGVISEESTTAGHQLYRIFCRRGELGAS